MSADQNLLGPEAKKDLYISKVVLKKEEKKGM